MAQKKYYETNEFKDIQKKWYKKLEPKYNQDKYDTLDTPSQRFKVEPEFIEYFYYCEKYLASGAITDKLDQFIFEWHCMGIPDIEIPELLSAHRLRTMSQQAVSKRIQKILKQAGIRSVDFGKK